METEKWCNALLRNCEIVQDRDESVSPEEAQRRFERYVELVDMVTGKEPEQVFRTLIDSVRVEFDYGAYEVVHNALWRFPPNKFASNMVHALPGFIKRMQKYDDQVARFLSPLTGWAEKRYLPAFVEELDKTEKEDRELTLRFVRERDEWDGLAEAFSKNSSG